MALGKQARAVLFGTPLLSRQLRKCIEAKGSVSEKEVREIFGDVGSNQYHKTLRQLQSQKVIDRQDGVLTFRADAPTMLGSQADRAWKAALLLKSFEIQELCKMAEIKWTYAQRLLSHWVKNGAAVKVVDSRKGAPAIWTMISNTEDPRPVRRNV